MPPPVSSLNALLDATSATRVWLAGHAVAAKRIVEGALGDAARPPTGPIDLAILAPLDADEALYFAGKGVERLTDKGRLILVREAPRQDPVAWKGETEDLLIARIESLGLRMAARLNLETGSALEFLRRGDSAEAIRKG